MRVEFNPMKKNELSTEPAIEHITVSSDAIQNLKMSWGGGMDWNGRSKNEDRLFTPLSVDPDFNKLFKPSFLLIFSALSDICLGLNVILNDIFFGSSTFSFSVDESLATFFK